MAEGIFSAESITQTPLVVLGVSSLFCVYGLRGALFIRAWLITSQKINTIIALHSTIKRYGVCSFKLTINIAYIKCLSQCRPYPIKKALSTTKKLPQFWSQKTHSNQFAWIDIPLQVVPDMCQTDNPTMVN